MRTEADAIRSLQRFFATLLPEPWDVRLTMEGGGEPQRPYALVEQNGTAASDGSANLQDLTIAYTVNLYLPKKSSRRTADDDAMALREQVFAAVKWGPDLRRRTTDRIPLYSYEPRLEVQRVRVRDATAGTWRLQHAGDWTGAIAYDAGEAAVQAAVDAILPEQSLVVARGRGVFDVVFIGELGGVDVPLLQLDTADLTGPGTINVIVEGAPAPWRAPSDYMRVTSFAQTTVRDEDQPGLVMVAVDLRCTFARGRPVPFDQMLLQRICATTGSGG